MGKASYLQIHRVNEACRIPYCQQNSNMKQPCPQHSHVPRLIQEPLADLTAQLRKKDRRVTGPRQAILEVLRRHAHPMNNKEIHDVLDKKYCDLATVYRTMHTLEGMGLVKRYHFGDGAARFELVSQSSADHHHHLICSKCSVILEIDDCIPPTLEAQIEERHRFQEVSHRLEFFGVCPKCQ